MKCLIEKCYNLLQMNVQVPNIPFNNISPTFYEDFKDYCRTEEWRIFIQKQIIPYKEQYLAMTINPCQMNMKIWWNVCYEALMVSIHKRNRILGESKIKFEDSIYNDWKEREKQETTRYQNYLIQLKRNNLTMRKQLHSTLRFFTNERGAWNEGPKDIYWMLSSHETRERMRCKLVENLQYDSHFEASRLRDCSGYGDTSTVTHIASSSNNNQNARAIEENKLENEMNGSSQTDTLAQKLQLNKEAINTQINEDFIGDEEFGLQQQANPSQQPAQTQQQAISSSESSTIASNALSRSSSVSSSIASSTQTSSTNNNSSYNSSSANASKAVQQEYYEAFLQLEEKEKLIVRSECELITVTRVVKGRFELTNKYVYFFDTYSSFYYEQGLNESNDNSAPGASHSAYNSMLTHNSFTATSAGFSCQDFDILNDFKIPLTQLKEVQLRRFNLRRSALEFFFINGSNFFINFNKSVSILFK
jgi:hypothetical protein